MALRVWLPLNGTLENKGISDATVTNYGVTIDNNGKIGKCYKNTGTTYCTIPIDIKVNSPFSLCFWYRIDTWASWGTAITLNATDKEDYIGVCPHSNGTQIGTNWYEIRNGTSTAIFDSYHSNTITTGTWNHIAITFDGSTKIKTYINGILVSDGTVRTTPLTDFKQLTLFKRSITSTYGKNSLNDVRVYNHCLSTKEVKEISQGLVLHYKLDGWSGGINQNLALDTANKICTATGGATSTSLDYGLQSNYNLIRGKKITISADIILENAATSLTSGSRRVGFEPAIKYSDNTIQYMGYWIGLDSTPKTLSGRYSTTVTVQNKDFQSIAQNGMYIQGLTSGTATIKNIKVELGDTATPWSPAPQDLGINTTKIIDSSGYGHDGTIVGTVMTETDASRYGISTKNTAQHLSKTEINFPISKGLTFAFWVKINTWGTQASGLFCTSNIDGNPSDYQQTAMNHRDSGIDLRVSGGGTYRLAAVPSSGVWHHCVFTHDGVNAKYYEDGALKATTAVAGSLIDFKYLYIGWSYAGGVNRQTLANWNDFRMYCTALSAEDILDLYHTPANMDNLGSIHTLELKEQQGNLLAKDWFSGSMTYDTTNKYWIITSNTSTSTWGIGPAISSTQKKIIPWGKAYIFSYEVYTPTAGTWMIDYNNYGIGETLTGNDNDNSRLTTSYSVPANKWTLITHGCANTNETKNPNHVPLYDGSTGIGPVMNNQSAAITWCMRNPQWYLVDADALPHIYKNGMTQGNALAEGKLNNFASFKNQEKRIEATGFIEK